MLKFKSVDDNLATAEYGGKKIERIYSEDGYSFTYTDKDGALAVRDYAVREEIPLVYTDVPREALGELAGLYRHLVIDALDMDASVYRVAVQSECLLFGEIEEISSQQISLTEIYDGDAQEYARLSKDPEGLKYWGYDYRMDNPDPSDGYFLSEMRRERALGTALSSAIRLDGRFVGEVLLYGFDYEGGGEIAIRLLPEYRGKGLGGEALSLLLQLAEEMGLISLYAEAFCENEASVRLFSAYMDVYERTEDKVYFRLSAKEEE